MISALKRLDKKFLIIAGFIIFLPIFIIVFLAIMQGCGNKKITHEEYEKKMVLALEKYINAKNTTPVEEGEIFSVELSTLVNSGYIKSTEKLLDDSSCKGSVSVRRNGVSVETTNGGYLNYIAKLECNNYSTISLVDKLKENIVTEESGLYQDGEGYIFKGDKVKNYITFFGNSYRIMGIDKNGILKLIKTEPEMNTRIWDNKYNIETSRASGKNIYKDSKIRDSLIIDYENVKKVSLDAKKQIVAYDACIGKRSLNELTIDSSIDCSEVLEKQVVSLMNVSDYAKASLDVDCTNVKSPTCNNYNYLNGVVSDTWTLNSPTENSYEVFFISTGRMEVQYANTYSAYNLVIYIDGNQKYISGNGASNNPYVIE